MASFVYDAAVNSMFQGDIALDTDTVKFLLVTSAYTANQTADAYVATIDAGYRVATTGALASKTFASQAFDAADPSIAALAGATVAAVVCFVDTGSDATSRLLSYHDITPDYVPATVDVVLVLNASGIIAPA